MHRLASFARQLWPRIPNLVVAVEGAGENDVSVTLDGKPIPSSLLGEEQPANPGPHRLLGKRGTETVCEMFIASD